MKTIPSPAALKLAGVMAGGELLQLRIAAQFLDHGLYGKGEPMTFDTNSAPALAIKNTQWYKSLKEEMVKRLGQLGPVGTSPDPLKTGSQSFYSEGPDLAYSVGKAKYVASLERIPPSATLYVRLSDRYDFEESGNGMGSIGQVLNTLGYEAQQAGDLIPYDWTIDIAEQIPKS